jgi:hypothetical protein
MSLITANASTAVYDLGVAASGNAAIEEGVAGGRGGEGGRRPKIGCCLAYMVWMERLYAVNLAVAENDGNGGGGGQGGEAGAPGSDGITWVNGLAVVAVAAAVEEEEEEGAVDCNGNHKADGNLGSVVHCNRKDGNGITAPRTGRMTTRTAATATGGGGLGSFRARRDRS